MSESPEPPFRRIGIAGLGLIGGSVALAARRAWPGVSIVAAVRRDTERARAVADRLVVDVAALADCDVIVVAVPLDCVNTCLEQLAHSGTAAVVTDISSTKRSVMAAATGAGLRAFVGGHPMAGGERPGLEFARADLFVGRPWLLVDGGAGTAANTAVEQFVSGLGAGVQWTDAETHDRTVAYVSHLPQILAAALMNTADGAVGTTGRAMAGNAFAEMTRLASSPSPMWTAVLAENRDYVTEALTEFARQLPAASDNPGAWADAALQRSGDARDRWRTAKKPD